MNITIARDGQQIGTFTLAEARARVLAGTLSANDWAWYDGAAEWTPLSQVPHFTDVSPQTPLVSAPAADQPRMPTTPAREKEFWTGSPSQLLNVGPAAKWAFFFGLLIVMAKIGATEVETADVIPILMLILIVAAPVCALSLIGRYFALRATKYVITNQRVKVIRGIFSKDVQELELFRVKDTSARQTLFLRLFGLGNITIHSGDRTSPILVLQAIPNAIAMREQIRDEVIALRQRFGVREMELM